MYFLRFTNTPEADLERGTSVHAGAGVDECSKEQMAEMFNCDEEDVIEINGMWHQVLDGLCGYQMEATTLEEAIEEAEEGGYQFEDVGKPVVYSGRLSDSDVPDGDCFTAEKIEAIL